MSTAARSNSWRYSAGAICWSRKPFRASPTSTAPSSIVWPRETPWRAPKLFISMRWVARHACRSSVRPKSRCGTPMQNNRDATEGDVNLGGRRASWQAENISPATRELLDEDARWFLHQSMSTPCLNALSGASGSWLTDLQGRRILDFHGNSLHQVGHGHPKVIEAIKQALDSLPFSPRRYTNTHAVELARRLCTAAPGGDNKLLFAPGGTAATGMALKLARRVTGRYKTLSMWD